MSPLARRAGSTIDLTPFGHRHSVTVVTFCDHLAALGSIVDSSCVKICKYE